MSKRKSNAALAEYSPEPSRICAVVSDIHFDEHDVPTWNCFRRWHEMVRPHTTVMLGDVVDLSMMSKYAPGRDDKLFAIPQIQVFVAEANALRDECERLVVLEGNHDERWDKVVGGMVPSALRGAIGLSLHEQCVAQGLREDIEWHHESTEYSSVQIAQFHLRHGHKQAGRFGGGIHLAANSIAKSRGRSILHGHHHRAGIAYFTAFDGTSTGVSNPCMQRPANHYGEPGPNWQRGWSVLEMNAPRYDHATACNVIVEKGVTSWGGMTFNGNG